MPEDQNQQRRAAAVPKQISEIDQKEDIRVRIVGTVISKDEDSVSLDDGSGTVEVFMRDEQIEEVEENQSIRVLGRVLPTPDSFEIQAEVVQDFSDVDKDNYDRVKKIVKS